MKIWANTLVKNEENFIWYSLMSIIDYVDKILVYDTGSTDNTIRLVELVKKEFPDKIIIKEVGDVDINEFTGVRQMMLEATRADWMIILDGDEVWWRDSIKDLIALIDAHQNLETVVNKYINLAGDIYHHQTEESGRYQIDGRIGHLTIRAINMSIPGLNFSKPHGQQGIYDNDQKLIQNRDRNKRLFVDTPAYLHFTNLMRTSEEATGKVPKRAFKFKYIRGIPFPSDFYYPEVFFNTRPKDVKSPWVKRPLTYEMRAMAELPLRLIKRKSGLFNKSGY